MNIFDAQGLRKASGGQWRTLYDLVLVYSERVCRVAGGDQTAVNQIDAKVRVGLYQRKDLSGFWNNLRALMAERLSHNFIVRRPKLAEHMVSSQGERWRIDKTVGRGRPARDGCHPP